MLCALVASLVAFVPNVSFAAGVDSFAHFGMSYVINDQLKRNAGFNDFWAGVTTIAIGAAKERFIDDHWDSSDFAADCAGVLFYQVKF